MKNVPLLFPDHSTIEFIHVPLDELPDLPMFGSRVSAGFPSPADDYMEYEISIKDLIRNPTSTFYARVKGDSLEEAHILDGDILVIDKSLKPTNNKIIVGVLEGEFTAKRYIERGKKVILMPANKKYQPIEITEEMGFMPWGIVVLVIHQL